MAAIFSHVSDVFGWFLHQVTVVIFCRKVMKILLPLMIFQMIYSFSSTICYLRPVKINDVNKTRHHYFLTFEDHF